MIAKGLILMGLGMLTVFSFLVLLIFSTKLMSALVTKFFPEKEEPAPSARRNNSSADLEIAVAIAAAQAYSAK